MEPKRPTEGVEETEPTTVEKSKRRTVAPSTLRMVPRSPKPDVDRRVKVTLALTPQAAKRLKDHAYHASVKPGEYLSSVILARVPRWAASRQLDPAEASDAGESGKTGTA